MTPHNFRIIAMRAHPAPRRAFKSSESHCQDGVLFTNWYTDCVRIVQLSLRDSLVMWPERLLRPESWQRGTRPRYAFISRRLLSRLTSPESASIAWIAFLSIQIWRFSRLYVAKSLRRERIVSLGFVHRRNPELSGHQKYARRAILLVRVRSVACQTASPWSLPGFDVATEQ